MINIFCILKFHLTFNKLFIVKVLVNSKKSFFMTFFVSLIFNIYNFEFSGKWGAGRSRIFGSNGSLWTGEILIYFLFNQLFDIVKWGSDAAIVRDIFPNEETETIAKVVVYLCT